MPQAHAAVRECANQSKEWQRSLSSSQFGGGQEGESWNLSPLLARSALAGPADLATLSPPCVPHAFLSLVWVPEAARAQVQAKLSTHL